MTRARTAAGLVVLLLAAGGCTGEDQAESDVARTARVPTATGPTPSEDAALAPVRFFTSGRACMAHTGPTVMWEDIRVREPLTLRSLEAVDAVGGFDVDATSVVAIPEGEVPLTGTFKGPRIPEKWSADVAWDDRERLAGAAIQPGDYYVFLEGRVTGPGSDRGFELSWTDASGTAGSTLWDVATTYRKKC